MKIGIGNDHAAVAMKNEIKAYLEELGHEVVDFGISKEESCDYPVYGEELWNRFRMKDKKIIGWYYIGIRDALKDAFEGVEAYEEYSRLVHKNFE